MPDLTYLNLIERDLSGPSFSGLYASASTWYDFFLRLCFETQGVQVITLFSVLAFAAYRLSGSPLDVSVEEKQCEREELWAAHNARFAPKRHPKWKSPAGEGVVSWNGTGEGAGIRKAAALGDKSVLGVHPKSRDEAMIAGYQAADDFSNVMSNYGGGGRVKKDLAKDAMEQDAKREEETREATLHVTPSIKYHSVPSENVRVCIVGEPGEATVSIVTVHDTCTTYRNGMLQMSVECTSQMTVEARRNKGNKNVPVPCFYHISMPGHDLVDEERREGIGDIPDSAWTMDKLGGKVNRVVRELGISGRYILMGEGAGANVVVRAACEEKQRAIDDYNALRQFKGIRTGALLTGIVLLQTDFNGPTVGDNLNAGVGKFFMKREWLGLAAGRFGVPESVSGHPGYVSDFSMMDATCVSNYASSYLSSESRTDLGIRRTRALGGTPNLVMFAEVSVKGRENAVRVVNQMDQGRGSGGIGVPLRSYVGESYGSGGGAVLKDTAGRSGVIQAIKLFVEAA